MPGVSLRELWSPLNPQRMKGTFVLLKGYIDESISKDQRVFTLSALVGIGEQWDALSKDWTKMLVDTNVWLVAKGRKPINRYHATECNARHNEFEGWDFHEQIELTKTMLAIVKSYALKTISYSIDLKSLALAIPGKDLVGSAYAISTLFLVYDLGVWLSVKGASSDTRLTLIHDWCDYDGEILARFKALTSDPSFKHGGYFTTCAPMKWQDCIPLQPADLMAYENMKDVERRLDDRKRRKTFDLIVEEGNTGIRNHYINTKTIESLKPFIQGLDLPTKIQKRKRAMSVDTADDFQKFSDAMDNILKANPKVVKAAMEAERVEREEETKRSGKRGKGRPPKTSSSGPASSNRDA